VAAYELLSRLAESLGDTQTAELAREHLGEDKKCADEIAKHWDDFFQLTLADWRESSSRKAPATV
jgi:ferritin-like metal-binding protein YciE